MGLGFLQGFGFGPQRLGLGGVGFGVYRFRVQGCLLVLLLMI